MHTLGTVRDGNQIREVSVSTALSNLRIDDPAENGSQSTSQTRNSVNGSLRLPWSSTQAAKQKSKVEDIDGVIVVYEGQYGSLVTPRKTPSQIPVPLKAEAVVATPATPSKFLKKSPTKPQFLTKDSNITTFDTAWDVRGRLEDMEAMYLSLKDTVAATKTEQGVREEAIAQYKARSTSTAPNSVSCATHNNSASYSKRARGCQDTATIEKRIITS